MSTMVWTALGTAYGLWRGFQMGKGNYRFPDRVHVVMLVTLAVALAIGGLLP